MNVTKLTVDAAGANVELYDGWKWLYKFRVSMIPADTRIPTGTFRMSWFPPNMAILAPATVPAELPTAHQLPSADALPTDFNYLRLQDCGSAEWFRQLARDIVRMYQNAL